LGWSNVQESKAIFLNFLSRENRAPLALQHWKKEKEKCLGQVNLRLVIRFYGENQRAWGPDQVCCYSALFEFCGVLLAEEN